MEGNEYIAEVIQLNTCVYRLGDNEKYRPGLFIQGPNWVIDLKTGNVHKPEKYNDRLSVPVMVMDVSWMYDKVNEIATAMNNRRDG